MVLELAVAIGGVVLCFGLTQVAGTPGALVGVVGGLAAMLAGVAALLFSSGVNEFVMVYALVFLAPALWALMVGGVARGIVLAGRGRSPVVEIWAAVVAVVPLAMVGV